MKRWKKWLIRVGLGVVVLPTLFAVGSRYYTRWTGEARLTEVRAGIDASDPGWRLDDILAAREAAFPPDDQNPMSLMRRIHPREPEAFKGWSGRDPNWLADLDPNRLPDPAAAAEAACVRAECRDIIEPLRRLRHMTAPGGYKLDVKPNVLNTILEPTQQVRGVMALLYLDAMVAALDSNPNRAVESTHAVLNAARGIGDEPFLISMLVRMAGAAIARNSAERVLAWGEPKAGLAELQAAFAAEAEEPLLTIGLRGERAMFDRLFENLDTGAITMNDVSDTRNSSFDPLGAAGWWLYRSRIPDDRAYFLETMNRLIDISRMPAPERQFMYDEWEQTFRAEATVNKQNRQRILTTLLLPAVNKVAAAELRTRALLRSAAAGIACERFRQANGRWPNDLAEVPKAILPAVPLDPCDGQPLRYRRTDDGVVVYSVGPDLSDDGGILSPKGEPGTDQGFRLWDPKHRRAAPLPKPAADPDDP